MILFSLSLLSSSPDAFSALPRKVPTPMVRSEHPLCLRPQTPLPSFLRLDKRSLVSP